MSETTMSREPVSAADFPEGFLWGCSSSSYQTEGSPRADGKGPSIWDAFCREPGRVAAGHSGDVACDSYRRAADDVALLAGLGVKAYRLSLSWPRVQPSGKGAANAAGLAYYDGLVDSLLEAGIEPWLTLYHWDLPLALEEAGGWPARDTAFRFADFAEIAYRALGDRVRSWVTLNEPWCAAFLGYRSGEHAPGRRDPEAAYRAVHHLLLGHGLAVEAFEAAFGAAAGSTGKAAGGAGRAAKIGIVLNPATPSPASAGEDDRLAAERFSVERTGLWLDPLHGRGYPEAHLAARGIRMPVAPGDLGKIALPCGFLGINYYNEDIVAAAPAGPGNPDGVRYCEHPAPRTDMGWPIVPEGLSRMLERISAEWAPGPLYVTENGAAFRDAPSPDGAVHDEDRIQYIRSHIASCRKAIDAGVPLGGYFVWTLMDNFEWNWGYTKKFGLVAVDRESGARRPKDSYGWYRDFLSGRRI
jgi:beta-glucosidase